ncbi:branched-chain amino acid ABC transporter permease [Polymorphum gilvum]|uniref:ABC-type transport system permease protein II (Probable substrates branched-chain/neutral amino acids) 2 n=1 Tax=Polymorphum gilvum (strain LMG 25793 / CGMCC 1.9160 / SL003B-26A1) TaxID=991905 RepID=F2IWX0_POLGS|nr:branched-chain amino acid ABC transporter permease [Polymorphum gilvum]ADZ71547.1 ABC-type transport system permease protein II (Probable substrates branched-chain/neutral amino acids) 2 [Polymorphum gilvum SL003B-26A1]
MRTTFGIAAVAAVFLALALAPFHLGTYGVGLLIGLTGYVTLASAWALFSGPTRFVSLATVAFFGIGAYTTAVLYEVLPPVLVLAVAGLIGFIVALVVGLSTLRLAGVYFVIFTFGLAELVRQLVTWYEVNVTGTLGRYLFVDFGPEVVYWQLLALCAVTIGLSFLIQRSRLGLALKMIGDDEVVAEHCGLPTARVKLALFAVSSVIITLVGAIQAPRWTYIEPTIVFNPTISFLTLIMALLGGAGRLWGPVVGAVPLFLLFEWLSANFPNHYSIILGLLFMAIVFVLPRGVLEFLEGLVRRQRSGRRETPFKGEVAS